jgi:hypothetical protein
MTGKERFHAIFRGESDRSGFWQGNPHEAILPNVSMENFAAMVEAAAESTSSP